MAKRPQAKKGQANPGAGGASRADAGGASRAGAGGASGVAAGGASLRAVLLGALILLAATAPYARSLHFGFVWDDPYVIGPHLDVRGWEDVARIWSTPFDNLLQDVKLKRTYFRPAVLLSLGLDRGAWGENPRGYHRTNAILYAMACVFLWLFAWEISGRPLAATAGTLLFALHPAHPESVCFISGRTDVMGGAFLFAALWAAARLGPGIRRPWLKLLPAALLLVPGLYAKEIVFFASPLVPVALWIRDRRMAGADLLRAVAPVAAAALLYLATRFAVLGMNPMPTVTPIEGTTAQILTSVAVVARYLPLLFTPLWLSARHETMEVRGLSVDLVAGSLTLAAMAAGLWIAWRRRSPWLLPLGLYAATLLPICYVRLLSGAIMAERFLFVPSAAVAVAVALLPGALAAWRALDGRGRRSVRAAAGGAGPADAGPGFLLVAGAAAVWLLLLLLPRVAIWKDEGTLFLSMLRDSPESPHVHAILGGYYYRTRDLPRSAHHYRRAYALHPSSSELLLNLGAAEDEMGQSDSAFTHIRLLNALAPSYGPGWYALGNLYARIDRPDSAMLAYREAIRLMPSLAQAENNLGAVLERMGRMEEALSHYRRSLKTMPGYQDAENNLRRLSAELGRPEPGLPPADTTRPARLPIR
jgi:tetratricopeptide (TPR) repeat protein